MKTELIKLYLVSALAFFIALPVQAASFIQIAMASNDIPFFLDDKGQVWAFQNPQNFEQLVKLPNLSHIKRIAPYIALDEEGHVFIWSLDQTKSNWGPDGLEEAIYSEPYQVKDLKDVTMIASSDWNHFAAVIGKKDIVSWEQTPEKTVSAGIHYGAIRKVSTRDGVRAISVHTSVIALFDDGSVVKFGKEDDGKGTLLTQLPGAQDVIQNTVHTVILTSNGEAQFLGEEKVSNVVALSLAHNDTFISDLFIKRDGSILEMRAPYLSDETDQSLRVRRKNAWQLKAGSAPVVQVTRGANCLMALDAEHKLWVRGVYGVQLTVLPIQPE